MFYLDLFKALVYTAVFSLAITPLDFALSSAIGAIDIPTDGRRMHSKPIPRLGGISIFVAFVSFGLLFCREINSRLICVLAGAVIIVVLGIADDCITLSAKTKLIFQSAAAILSVSLLNADIGFDWLFVVFGVIWLLTLTNAHNFIDGLDGLCVGVSLIESIALGIIFSVSGQPLWALFSFVVGGACIGFLPYNDKNARIFMGDTGAAFLGFVLGFSALNLFALDFTFIAFFSICFIFAVPLLDISFAVARRISQGKSPFASDRMHTHHLLADTILGHRKASVAIRIASFVFSIVGIAVYVIFA